MNIFNRVSLTEKLMFINNLQLMVNTGVALPRAFSILSEQTKNRKFKKILKEISEKIIKGKNLSECLSDYPHIFSDIVCSMISVGEEAGTLEKVLTFLTKQLEKERNLKSKIKNAMIYPIILISFMIIIGIVMMIIVVPKFSELFETMGITLPFATRTLIFIGNFLAKYWYLLPLIILILILLLRFILKTRIGKSLWDRGSLKIPIIGKIIIKTNTAYTTRTLSSLIASGVPIVRSLEIVSKTLGNVHYKKAIAEAGEKIKKGFSLSETIGEYKNLYPTVIPQIIRIGEETGKTSNVLEKIAEFFEKDIDNITQNLSAVLEPFLILLVGLCVGFFALSIIQPLYGMLNTI